MAESSQDNSSQEDKKKRKARPKCRALKRASDPAEPRPMPAVDYLRMPLTQHLGELLLLGSSKTGMLLDEVASVLLENWNRPVTRDCKGIEDNETPLVGQEKRDIEPPTKGKPLLVRISTACLAKLKGYAGKSTTRTQLGKFAAALLENAAPESTLKEEIKALKDLHRHRENSPPPEVEVANRLKNKPGIVPGEK